MALHVICKLSDLCPRRLDILFSKPLSVEFKSRYAFKEEEGTEEDYKGWGKRRSFLTSCYSCCKYATKIIGYVISNFFLF
jgi:hypothetical protein